MTPDGSGQVISNGNGWAFPVDAVLVQLDRDGTCSHFRADDLQEQR